MPWCLIVIIQHNFWKNYLIESCANLNFPYFEKFVLIWNWYPSLQTTEYCQFNTLSKLHSNINKTLIYILNQRSHEKKLSNFFSQIQNIQAITVLSILLLSAEILITWHFFSFWFMSNIWSNQKKEILTYKKKN